MQQCCSRDRLETEKPRQLVLLWPMILQLFYFHRQHATMRRHHYPMGISKNRPPLFATFRPTLFQQSKNTKGDCSSKICNISTNQSKACQKGYPKSICRQWILR